MYLKNIQQITVFTTKKVNKLANSNFQNKMLLKLTVLSGQNTRIQQVGSLLTVR